MHSGAINPIVVHSKMKRRYDHYRRVMWTMRLLSLLCFTAAVCLGVWMISGPAGIETHSAVEALVAAGLPIGLVAGMAALARLPGRSR